MKKKPTPIIFENFVVIKNDEFKRKINTEFFGMDIPVYEDDKKRLHDIQPQQDDLPDQVDVEDGFFLTGVGPHYLRQESRLTSRTKRLSNPASSVRLFMT